MINQLPDNDYIIFNPDTVWGENYIGDIKKMQSHYVSKNLNNTTDAQEIAKEIFQWNNCLEEFVPHQLSHLSGGDYKSLYSKFASRANSHRFPINYFNYAKKFRL